MPANPTTGYDWGLSQLPAPLMLLDVEYEQSADCKDVQLGCGGYTTYTFKALKKGSGVAEFKYGRRWVEKFEDTSTVKISVK